MQLQVHLGQRFQRCSLVICNTRGKGVAELGGHGM
jgi:hypothetical protein